MANLPDTAATKLFMHKKLSELAQIYGTAKVKVAITGDLDKHEAQVFCPCSSNEGSLTEERIQRLADNGIKVILSGANAPFGQEHVWQRAKLTADLGITTPPESSANGGSVTAASMEPIFRALASANPDMTAEMFVDTFLIPHIQSNTRERLSQLKQIAETENVDLYTAGEIAFRQAFKLPWSLDEKGILTD